MNIRKFFLLIIPYTIAVIILFFYSFPSHDEIILQLISKQSVTNILETIKAEPHPPLYYILLSAIRALALPIQRILFFTINYWGLVFILSYIDKIKNYSTRINLKISLYLFLFSPFFLKIASTLKQDSLSFILTLFVYVCSVAIITKKKAIPSKSAYLLISLVLIIFLTGYINGLISLLIVFSLLFLKKEYSLLVRLSLFASLFLFVYTLTFFKYQIIFNSSRFAWVGIFPSSFIFSLNLAFTNRTGIDSFTDVFIIPLISLTSLGLYLAFENLKVNRFENINKVHLLNAIILFLVFFLGYYFNLFVRDRYTAIIILILFFYASYFYTSKFKFFLKKYIYFLLTTYIIFNISLFGITNYLSFTNNTVLKLESLNLQKDYAFFGNNFGIMYPYAIDKYFNIKNIRPVYLNAKNKIDFTKPISKEILLMEGSFASENYEELSLFLREQKVNNLIYAKSNTPYIYDDKNNTLFLLLFKTCRLEKMHKFSLHSEFYIFEDCLFN